MATNPLIPLMGKPFDLQNNLLKGEQIQALDQRTKQQERLLPLRERLLKAQSQGAEQHNRVNQQSENLNNARIGLDIVERLKQEPDITRRSKLAEEMENQLGVDLLSDDMSDAALEDYETILTGVTLQQEVGNLDTIGTPFPMVENGQNFLALQVQNPDGSIGVVKTPVSGEFADRQGRTRADRVSEAAATAEVKQQAQTGGFGDRRQIETETAADIAGETRRGGDIEARRTDDINIGRDAAKGIPTLRRGLELMQFVKTGGFQAAKIRAKQFFGVEGADEGELAGNLGKAVLSQLRATFGAQFTQQEGARLEGIEARLGASTDTNIRLLNNALDIATDAAERGIEAATAARDFRTAQAIQDQMNLVLGEGSQQPTREQLEAEARRRGLIQ